MGSKLLMHFLPCIINPCIIGQRSHNYEHYRWRKARWISKFGSVAKEKAKEISTKGDCPIHIMSYTC